MSEFLAWLKNNTWFWVDFSTKALGEERVEEPENISF